MPVDPLKPETVAAFNSRMERVGIPSGKRSEYRKWVRYYLDFCRKFGHSPRSAESLEPFVAKLTLKNQTAKACEQARAAVTLLLERPNTSWKETSGNSARIAERDALAPRVAERPPQREPGNAEGKGASWEQAYAELRGAIRMRNYSDKTHQAYRMWVQKFQNFVKSKAPEMLGSQDVKEFLTDLAVRCDVAGSTQNQAFNALLFFYGKVLGREFGKIDGVVRAKRRPYVPVVLSRAEVEALITQVEPRYRLVTALLYGCGLRLSECLELRVLSFNLDAMLLTVHDGKGQKDRTVPLPAARKAEIVAQLESVQRRHREDLAGGYAGVFLPRQLEKKYRRAATELAWQWFFPAPTLTLVAASQERKRYHVHDVHVQASIKRAADQAGITKRVSPHTLRHTFASHLLLANYDLQTIQKLLGHSDIRTTMIYLQTVPNLTLKKAMSPLDL